ncbi:acetyltransferase [Stachybotrys elegans]|uniref:Acetyltransferase n=1 Tax=Stachybotrys elegans TaxID=80388 RepID=A0A8K0WPA2_9HYPO|nr:acetyltransferase [Stachybotrys elegans]
MAAIRPYRASDFDDMSHICRETLPPSLQASEAAWRLAPYIWTHQYTYLSPETCFVVDDGNGKVVGYCIGCPDVKAFCEAYDGYVRNVLEGSKEVQRPADMTTKQPWTVDGVINETCLSQTAHSAQWLLVEGNEEVLREGYGATMHIDLLAEWQGQGWGRRLIERFVEEAGGRRGSGGKGIWIGVAGDNAKVVPFYEKMGFRVWRWEAGNGICMVKDW